MPENSLYLLWLPKYFDEYYTLDANNKLKESTFLKTLKEFFTNSPYIYNCKLELHYKTSFPHLEQHNSLDLSFHLEKNSIGDWGEISFESINNTFKGRIVFSEFGFYYFEFSSGLLIDHEKIIKSFFMKEYKYPLLTDTQKDVLIGTFLNESLDYKNFNRKKEKRIIPIEDFILETYYKVNANDVEIHGKTIQHKIGRLIEYGYEVKKDEHYNFILLDNQNKTFELLKELIQKKFKTNDIIFINNMYRKIILDIYEEQAISKFLTMVVSAKYFDRITKSIREVREGLTGKIIYMTPEDTSSIDDDYQKNKVFKKWSEEKIENYVQLLISKKPLFTKIDNALKSAYYITIGNVTSLGHINDKENISQLTHYYEWKSLLAYFSETTKSLNSILHLYHSNRTYRELEEIKYYESNNHDKEDIELLIKSNENKLGSTEDSKTIIMMMAIMVTAMVAIPDMIGSIGSFPSEKSISIEIFNFEIFFLLSQFFMAFIFYILLLFSGVIFFRDELGKIFKTIGKNKKEAKQQKILKYIKSSSDDFDILEHRSNMPLRSFIKENDISYYKKISILYKEHISTHRFVRHIESLTINVCSGINNKRYYIVPEIVTLENMKEKNESLYELLKKNRTTKFSVNRIDKANIKVSMRYRINRIKINDFLDYYAEIDSYISFYKDYCTDKTKTSYYKNCKKINSENVIKKLKEDFKEINSELSFVAIYSFSLMSKTLDHGHEKEFDVYKDSFRIYFHIDKYPNDYYREKFELRTLSNDKEESSEILLEPYDALSEMIYLVFLGRLKGFNYEENLDELKTV